MTDFDNLATALRAWARNSKSDSAAVELLIWHERWLRDPGFTAECVRIRPNRQAWISWPRAAAFAESGLRASTSELTVLKLAAGIGEDAFGFNGLGYRHSYEVARAFAAALGQTIGGLIPEVGHNHPEFIPGTPEDCQACAREAQDEGRR